MLVERDRLLFLFRYEDADFAATAHCADEDVIANDVELFLVIASGVGGSG